MIRLWLKYEAFISGKVEVATNVFDGFFIEKARVVREFGALVDCKRYVRSRIGGDKVEFANDRTVMPAILSRCSVSVWVKNRGGGCVFAMNTLVSEKTKIR